MSNSISEKILKGSFAAIIFTLVGSVLAYLIRVIYSRTLSIESYGLFYAVFGLFSMLSTYADLGFGEAISYFIPKHFKKKKYVELWNTFLYGQIIQIGVSVILSIILIFFAPFLANNYFKIPRSEPLIYIFCIFLILNGFLNGINQIFTGLQKEKYFSTINTTKNILVFTLSLGAVVFGINNINTYGLIWIFSYTVTVGIYIYLLWSRHSFLTNNKLVKSTKFLNSLIKYAIPAFITTFIYSLMTASDIFFLTLFRGVVDVGVYNIIVPIASIGIIFLAPIHNILLPLTSYLMEGERVKLGNILNRIYKVIPFLGVYFALFIVMFPDAVIRLIFGEKWTQLASFPLLILGIGYVFLLLGNLLGTISLGLGKMRERLNILLAVGVLNVIFDAFFIWKFGLLGSVIMDSIAAIALVIVFTFMIKKYVNFQIPYGFYTILLLFSTLIFLSSRLININPHNLEMLVLDGIIYSLIFAGFGYIGKIYDKEIIRILIPGKVKNK